MAGTPDWSTAIEAALAAIRSECDKPDWDGHGSVAITERTIQAASTLLKHLARRLSQDLPRLDIIPEPDGEICIEWTVNPPSVLSISVGDHGKINFAAQFGGHSALHGWQRLEPVGSGDEGSQLDIMCRCARRVVATQPGNPDA